MDAWPVIPESEPNSHLVAFKLIMVALALMALLWVMIDTNRLHPSPTPAHLTSSVSTTGPGPRKR